MRAAFLGTPSAAIPSLAALADVATVELVITQPDAARGRSKRPLPPPVKVAAEEWGIAVSQPATHGDITAALAAAEVDVAVVVAYGRILKPEALQTTALGFVNVHFSLLPRWRGAAPVARAILAGDARTGVTLMKLDEGMDTGPLLGVLTTEIGESESAGDLTARLAASGATMLGDVLALYTRGKVHPAPQIETGATHAAPLTTAEAEITAATDAGLAHRMVRAYAPRPGAWTVIDGVRTKLLITSPSDETIVPGTVVTIDGAPVMGLAGGALALQRIQPSGKRLMSGREWANGRHGAQGSLSTP